MPYFSIICAVSGGNERLFSSEEAIPWKIPEDTKFFKLTTEKEYKKNCKNILIMGKNTFLSKPPLGNSKRVEVVVSKHLSQKNDEKICKTLQEALVVAETFGGKIFVIGGTKLIEEAWNMEGCEEIFETVIDFNVFKPLLSGTFLSKIPDLFYLNNCDVIHTSCQKTNCDAEVSFKVYNRHKTGENIYLQLVKNILDYGEQRNDRTGTGTLSLFGEQIELNISESFPLLTTKKLKFEHILLELLWFISGSTNTKFLTDNGVNIWKGNTSREFLDKRGLMDYEEGDVGPLYGHQWRNFGGNSISKGVDQISRILELLKTDPYSRRILMSAWNPVDLDKMALEPCHILFNLYVSEGKYLDGKLYMRSCDSGCGLPYNIASYSLLLHMFGHLSGYTPRKLIISFGDVHIYSTHMDAIKEQLTRPIRPFPKLKITRKHETIENFDQDSFELTGYFPHPFIKMEMAV